MMLSRSKYLPVILALACSAILGQGLNRDEILDSLFSWQAKKYREITSLVYHGNSVYHELTDADSVKKVTVSERKIFQKGREQQSEQYMSMSVDGRILGAAEMNKQVADWKKKGRRNNSKGLAKMPFYPEMREEYEYSMLGFDTVDGYAAWKIGFKPRVATAEHFTGTFWVVREDFDVIRMESRPAKMPGVVKKMNMVMEFRPEQGYWLPRSFNLKAKIKVKFLITLANVNFTVEDRYSRFSLNQEIPDSVFKE